MRSGLDFHSSNAWPLTWALLAALALHALAILIHSVTVPSGPAGRLAPRLMDITLVAPVKTTPEPVATTLPGPAPAEPEPPVEPAPLAPEPPVESAPLAPEPPVELAPPAPEPAQTVAEPPPAPAPAMPRPATPAPVAPKPPPKPTVPTSRPVKPETKPPPVQKAAPEKPAASRPLSAAELMSRSLQMARSGTGPQDETGSDREKQLDPAAMTMAEEFYLQAWMRKVEQVGSLNFPEAARRLNQPAGPTLDVAVRADGTVKSIHIVRSSGNQALDDAALGIVSLAAPFAPFPEALRRDYDVLHIVRRWKFDRGQLYGQ